MTKIFLSHSSKDKARIAIPVYNRLCNYIGKQHIIIDQFTFEEGRRTEKEIVENIEQSDLIVFLISDTALDSSWVQKEFELAKKMEIDKKCQICPILISEDINHKDPRIPQWLSENYNLKKICYPRKIADVINERYIEIITEKYPKTEKLKKLFVGRFDYLKQIEERLDSIDSYPPKAIFVSGIKGVGRKSLLTNGLKNRVVKESYGFPEIPIKYDESIEDFILKIADLGLTSEVNISDISGYSLKEKIEQLIKLTKELQDNNEIIIIRDDGCIVNKNSELSNWFYEVINSPIITNSIVYLVTSRYKIVKNRSFDDLYYTISLPELNIKEREGLLKRLMEIEEIEIDPEDKKSISNLLNGFPKQVQFAVKMLKELDLDSFNKQRYRIIDFGNSSAAPLLQDIQPESLEMNILVVLSMFDYIDKKILRNIFEETDISLIIENFYSQGFCEYLGTSEEYIRLNDIIKDFIVRGSYKLTDDLQNKINTIAEAKIQKDEDYSDDEDISVPQLLFSLKQSLINGEEKIPDEYLIPSIYLSTVSELYHQKKYKDVVRLADISLQRKNSMEPNITSEIRYYLCLALAQQKNDRFTTEVQAINGPDHNFLFGFYYRKLGKYSNALAKYEECLKVVPNHTKARREKVQTLIGMQNYDDALFLAEKNYNDFKDNPYHIQAYFNCLIKSEEQPKDKELLQRLIADISIIQTQNAQQMSLSMQAQYEAFIGNNEAKAVDLISKAIEIDDKLPYAWIVKFDIAEKFQNLELMKSTYNSFSPLCSGGVNFFYGNAFYMESIIILYEQGNLDKALSLFKGNARNFTNEAIDRVLKKITKIYNNMESY